MRVIIFFVSMLAVTSAFASADDAKQGRYALSAWQCFAFAGNAEKNDEQQRLFDLGLDAAKKFLEAARANKISREEASKNTPMSVLMSSQGPTVDFAAGRIFEAVTTDAYEKMSKTGADGMPLPTEKWITDKETLKSIGERMYRQSNCDLLK